MGQCEVEDYVVVKLEKIGFLGAKGMRNSES